MSNQILVGASPQQAEFTVGITEKNLASYWDMVNAGFHDAGRRLGLSIAIDAPSYEDVASQVAMTSGFLDLDVDAIAFVASDSHAFKDVCDRAGSLGKPVIAFDLEARDSSRLLYVGTQEPYDLGQQAGRLMVDRVITSGPVIVQTGSLSAPGAVGKLQGFIDVLTDAGIQTVGGADDGEHIAVAYQTAKEYLEKYPTASGIYGVYGYHPVVQGRALEEAGLAGSLALIGFDMLPETVELIQRNTVSASIWIREYYFGFFTATALYNALKLGGNNVLDFMRLGDQAPTERTLRLPTEVYTSDNIGDFVAWAEALDLPGRTTASEFV